jgi:hypothetical protein
MILFFALTGCGVERPEMEEGMAGEPSLEEMEEEIRYNLHIRLLSGYYTNAESIDQVVDLLSDEYEPETIRPAAVRLAESLTAELIEGSRSWPSVTDCDRLDRAFAALESGGIIARQNFSCCGTCGAGEIWEEMEAQRERGREIRGYAFFHEQDTDSAVEGYGLYLSYGSTEEDEGPALQIAQEIVNALKNEGLQTDWDGTWEKRIGVELNWKKRGPWLVS